MIDIKLLRENPELVQKGIENKNDKSSVDEILAVDLERREKVQLVEDLKAKRNAASQQIGILKKAGESTDNIMTEMKEVSDEIKKLDDELKEINDKFQSLLEWVPNLPHSSTPVGKSADDNVDVRSWTPDDYNFDFEFKPLDHIELGKKLGILDFERGAKISGSGFPVYVGKGATLERALINFMLDYHIENHGYKEVFPPFIVNPESMYGTGAASKNAGRYVSYY